MKVPFIANCVPDLSFEIRVGRRTAKQYKIAIE